MRRALLFCAWCACLATAAPQPKPQDWAKLIADGETQVTAGNYSAAIAPYREALRVAESFGPEDICVIASLDYLGNIYASLGMWMDSDQHYRRAIKIAEHAPGAETITYGLLLFDLGTMYGNSGAFDRAEAPLKESLTLLSRILPAGDPRIGLAHASYAAALMKRRQYSDAEEHLRHAIPVLESSNSAIPLGGAWNTAGLIAAAQGRNEEAKDSFEQAVRSVESVTGPDHPSLIVSLTNLAVSYANLRRNADAETAFLRVLSICEHKLNPDHPEYGRILANYAQFLRIQNRKSEAKKVAARSESILRQSARRNGTGMTVDAAAFRR